MKTIKTSGFKIITGVRNQLILKIIYMEKKSYAIICHYNVKKIQCMRPE